jgi:hypothetical protein
MNSENVNQVTRQELRAFFHWMTTSELQEKHSIPPYMVYRWGKFLTKKGLARKLDGQRGLWLVAPEAVPFLRSRKGRPGRPKEEGDEA